MKDVKSWYVDAARYFRAMGFFSKYSGLSDEELASRLMDEVSREWDDPCPPGAGNDTQKADMFLLMTDRDRVWHGDLEFVYPGENAYVQFLNGLAAVSRGAFRPIAVSETGRARGSWTWNSRPAAGSISSCTGEATCSTRPSSARSTTR